MNLDIPDPQRLVAFLLEHVLSAGQVVEEERSARILKVAGSFFYVDTARASVSGPYSGLSDLYARTGRVRPTGMEWPKIVEWEGLVVVLGADGSVYGPRGSLHEVVDECGSVVFTHEVLGESPVGSGTSAIHMLGGAYFARLDQMAEEPLPLPSLDDALGELDALARFVIRGSSLSIQVGDHGREGEFLAGFRVWEDEPGDELAITVNGRLMRFSKTRPPVVELPATEASDR